MNKLTKKLNILLFSIGSLLAVSPLYSQSSTKQIVISGARFTNTIFEKWIEEYKKIQPEVKIYIDNKGAAEHSDADIIIHGNQLPGNEIDKSREYYTIAKYAIVPIANSNSPFFRLYGQKGLNKEQLKQAFFFDPFNANTKDLLKVPYNAYIRVQKAPVAIAFASNFGYDQKDLNGRAIAGTDLHLIQAVQRDSVGITFSPLPLVYSPETGNIIEGIAIIPVDFDGNNKISENEKFYENLSAVLVKLSNETSDNIPVSSVVASVDKSGSNKEAVEFLKWILEEGKNNLNQYGFLKPDISAGNFSKSIY